MIRPHRLLLAIAMLLVSWAGARTEETGNVKGTVTTGPDRQVVADAIVMIEGPADGGGTTRATMNQQHEAFVPHVLGVAVGTTVDFPNGDPVLHNVFSTSPPRDSISACMARARRGMWSSIAPASCSSAAMCTRA